MQQLPDNLWRRCIELFLMAGEYNKGGLLPPIEDISWLLRVDNETLINELQQLQRIGIVDYVQEVLVGNWVVVNFSKRQKAVSARQRVADMRERQRTEQLSNDSCYEPVTTRNTDTDTDKDIDTERTHTNGNGLNGLSAQQTKRAKVSNPSNPSHPNGELSPHLQPLLNALLDIIQEKVGYYADDAIQEKVNTAVTTLFGHDATPELVAGFPAWWQRNGHYQGLPAVKSVLNSWLNYAATAVKRERAAVVVEYEDSGWM